MDIMRPAAAPVPAPSPAPVVTAAPEVEAAYHPLSSTIAIYLGWLLFWCGALYLLGGYQAMKVLPFELPLLTELITSPFILAVSFGSFLFLMFANVHRALKGGPLLAVAFGVIGLALAWLYTINVR